MFMPNNINELWMVIQSKLQYMNMNKIFNLYKANESEAILIQNNVQR